MAAPSLLYGTELYAYRKGYSYTGGVLKNEISSVTVQDSTVNEVMKKDKNHMYNEYIITY